MGGAFSGIIIRNGSTLVTFASNRVQKEPDQRKLATLVISRHRSD